MTKDNFSKLVGNINNQITGTYLGPLNLSLPGRINITTSMLYSQINYLVCFLPVPDNILIEYDKLITDFVEGPINIAKKCLYKNPENIGLSLLNLCDFLDAQKCAWIKRSGDLSEPWKVILYINFTDALALLRRMEHSTLHD